MIGVNMTESEKQFAAWYKSLPGKGYSKIVEGVAVSEVGTTVGWKHGWEAALIWVRQQIINGDACDQEEVLKLLKKKNQNVHNHDSRPTG